MSSISVNTITDASGGTTTSINGLTPTVSNMAGRNRIINGDMRIDQRNAGASVTITTGGGYIYPVDRFGNWNNSGTNYTAEQVEDAPAGFYHSTRLTFGSAISLTTQNEATFFQIIEGFNVADFGWGAAGAQAITVGMWVKASFTGTFSIGFCNADGTRSYATTYTISSANTWEYKTFVIPGDTSGTWVKTNEQGLFVRWNIVAGSNFNVAANNTWATRAGAYNSADGAYGTKAIGSATSISAGATWQITGVQLEEGSVATPFERRQYGQELALCQRYYVGLYQYWFTSGYDTSYTTINQGGVAWSYQMRATPSIVVTGGAMAGHHNFAPIVASVARNGASLAFQGSAFRSGANTAARVSFTLSAEL